MGTAGSSPTSARRDLARRTLDQAYAQNGMTLVVDGMAGMGKTHFLRELMGLADADKRWTISYVRADEVEHIVPYAFLERLLASPGIAGETLSLLDDPQVQPVAVGRELLRLRQRMEHTGYLVVIDDAQWIDDESVRVLRYLLPRLTRQRVMAAYGVRTPHQPGSFGAHLKSVATDSPLDRRIEIEPLDVRQIRAFAAERFGATISPRSARALHNATGGSFLHVTNVLEHLTPTEISQLHMAWDIPLRGITADDNPLLAGYRGLDAPARATAEVVSVAGSEISRRDLAAVAGELGESVQVTEAISAGVLVESGFGTTVAPVHALVAHAVREAMPIERTRAVCRALASVTDGYQSVRFQLSAAEELDDTLLAQVRHFVAEGTEQGAFDGVNAVLRNALALVPSIEDPRRQELLLDLGLVNLRSKSIYLVLDLFEDYHQLPPSMVRDLLTIALAAYHPEQPFPQDKVMALLLHPPSGPDELTVQAYLSFLLTIMTMRTADQSPVPMLIGQAKARFAQISSDRSVLSDPRLAWMVEPDGYIMLLDCFATVQPQRSYRMSEAMAAVAVLEKAAPLLHDTPLKADSLATLAGTAAHAGAVLRAQRLAEQAVRLLDRVAKPWLAGTARVILADCLILRGELAAAADLLAVIEDVSYDSVDLETRPMCTALRATVAAITGQPDAATLAQQAEALHQFEWEGFGPDFAVLAACEIARAGGDPDGVLAAIEAAPVEAMTTTRRGFLTHRAHALLDLGRIAEVAELITTLEEWRGTRWQECWGGLAWLQARFAEAKGDDMGAEELYRTATSTEDYPLPLALALVDHAGLLVRSDRADEARAALTRALAILTRIGATAYQPRVREALTTLRTAGQDQQTRLLSELTGRESEIASHLAHGRSNQQIANTLVVSVATVRFHVSNVLRKLQVASRAEVARVLRGSALDNPAQNNPGQNNPGQNRSTLAGGSHH